MSRDYRWNAADVVMRKSMGSLELLLSLEMMRRSYEHGLTDVRPTPVDPALILETDRTLEMAIAALDAEVQETQHG